MHNQPTYQSLSAQADELPVGKERIALREKAINLADLTNDDKTRFAARQQFIVDIAQEGSVEEKYFTVFPWMLNYIKTKGTQHEKMMVLWYYKWVLLSMPEFGTIPRQQILNALEDMRKWYQEFGSNDKMYHLYAALLHSQHFGEPDKALKHYNRWLRYKKSDYLDDCQACVVNKHVNLLLDKKELTKALKIAEPLLAEKMTCRHIPKDTYTSLVLPLLQVQDIAQSKLLAQKLSRKMQSITHGNTFFNAHVLIILYSRTGEFTKALRYFENYFGSAFQQKNLYSRFYFYVAATYLFTHLQKDSIKLKLPVEAPFYQSSGEYNVAEVSGWFDAESTVLATIFNDRNGNRFFPEKKAELLSL